jgi:hypothetical protein
MGKVQTILRLPRTYDAARLRQDLETAMRIGREHENRGDYHDGGWTAIALTSVDGSLEADALRWAGWDANYQKTAIVPHTPYFDQIMDEIRSPKARVRLLQLKPGADIHEHRDDGDGWAVGKVRLHIPIITNDDVYFYVDGQRVIMNPGELWYCDFTRPHRVANKGNIGRIHLVMDVMVDDWLKENLFPPEPVTDRLRNAAQRAVYQARRARYELPQRLGLSGVKQKVGSAISDARSRIGL